MKWLILPSMIVGGIMGAYGNNKKTNYNSQWQVCVGDNKGHCTWYTCFSGYTCGGGGVEFKCLRFGGSVIDP